MLYMIFGLIFLKAFTDLSIMGCLVVLIILGAIREILS
jgi:hypothetical protein